MSSQNLLEEENAQKQLRDDLWLLRSYKIAVGRNSDDSIVYDLIKKRFNDIVGGIENSVENLINSPQIIIPELDNVWVEPGNCICEDFPPHIFNYTDRLTLLNEGYALYAEENDRKKVERILSDIIHSIVVSLSEVEKDLLVCSEDFHAPSLGVPWYEQKVLDDLFRGVDYEGTMKKVDTYNEDKIRKKEELIERTDQIYAEIVEKGREIFNTYSIYQFHKLIPIEEICRGIDLPREIFSNTEKLRLIHMGYVKYKSEGDSKIVQNQINNALGSAIAQTSIRDINLLRDREEIEPDYEYSKNLLDELYYYEDIDTLVAKINAYASKRIVINHDFHYGVLESHSLFDSLIFEKQVYDETLVEVFARLVLREFSRLENPYPVLAKEIESKNYKQAIKECCDIVYKHFRHLFEIDKMGSVRNITFDFIEKINRKLACYLYNIDENEREQLTKEDIQQMKLPLSDFDYLRIKNSVNKDLIFEGQPKYLTAYIDKDEDWDAWKYNLPPLSIFD